MRVGLLVDINSNDYRQQIHHARELGFECGQLVVWDMDFYTDENLRGLRQALADEKFDATALWCGWSGPVVWSHPYKYHTLGLVPDWLRQQRLEDLRRGAKFAYDLGIDTVASHLGFIPDDPFDPRHIAIVQSLKLLCGELKARGQRFASETGEELPLTLSILMGEVRLDNFGVNFDPANLLSGGRGNPNDAMELLSSRIFGMHAKDAVPAKFGEFGGRQTPIGEGRVDFRRLLEQLKAAAYDGDIVIEHEMAGRELQRDDDIRSAKKYLEALVKEVFA